MSKIPMQQKNIAGLRSLMRRAWAWYSEERKQCLDGARVVRGKYKCEGCKALVGPKDIQVDHIKKVTADTGLKFREDIAPFVDRLFCPLSGLMALCKPCHSEKTKLERQKIKRKSKGKKK